MAHQRRDIANNKKAYHDYFIDETFEAGLVLTGTEIRSLRDNRASLRDSYALVRKGEVWLLGVHIAPYSHGNRANVDPNRQRKLLLHKNEIRYLIGKTKEKGYALVPLKIYLAESGKAKVELGLGRGKKLYDKRASIAERDTNRDTERALRERQKGE
jgi:SsrA-binding protein